MSSRLHVPLAAILISSAIACSNTQSTTANPIAPTPVPPAAPTPAPTPQQVVLSGTVFEVPPTLRAVPGARVEVATGPQAGRYMTTDTSGTFHLVDLTPGVITVVVRMAGYQPWQITNLSVTGDATQDVHLFPTPPTDAAGVTATARCRDAGWSWLQTRAEACAANGGIAYGVCPGPLCDPQARAW